MNFFIVFFQLNRLQFHTNFQTIDVIFLDQVAISITNSNFSDNSGMGIGLEDIIGTVRVTNTSLLRNSYRGLSVERMIGPFQVKESRIINNSDTGLVMTYSSTKHCVISDSTVNGNELSGLHLVRYHKDKTERFSCKDFK